MHSCVLRPSELWSKKKFGRKEVRERDKSRTQQLEVNNDRDALF